MARRWTTTVIFAALAWPVTAAFADPLNEWDTLGPGYDCTGDPYNPVRNDGTRDPHGDPVPGTPAWDARDVEHESCTDQRDWDTREHPFRNVGTAQYGVDEHRMPARFNNVRWRYEHFSQLDGNQIPDVPSAEIFRPCPTNPLICPNLPAGLQRFDPPYPVVVVFHGVIAQKAHHRFETEVFAENGYMAIGVNGTIPTDGGPNVQRAQNGDDVLRWLAGQTTSNVTAIANYGAEADLDRVAFTGHSQGGAVSLGYQGDPRVHAIIAWDAGDTIAANNCALNPLTNQRTPCAPVMYQRTDGGFATPNGTRYDYPTTRNRGLATYLTHKQRGMDMLHSTIRATVHTDWNGYGVGLAGNRYAEMIINYLNLPWLDRHLRGKLAFDAQGLVKTQAGRTAAQERAFRQAIANDAFERLTARYFDDSVDKHNISMGMWDPDLALANPTDPYAGNVPYQVEGLSVLDRYSPYFLGYCAVSVPDYVHGGTGKPGDPVPPVRRADTGSDGDLRLEGCPEL
jgi:chlorophyllase-like protein